MFSALELFFAIVLGLLFGNYLTTFYHRITNKLPINGVMESGMKPHCDSCGHELRYYEYFPVLSWIFCRFRCNYCGVSIPKVYFLLEFTSMLISIALWFLVGFGSLFIALFFSGLFFLLWGVMKFSERLGL